VPEQTWENPNLPASPYGSDPTTASIGFVDGQAAATTATTASAIAAAGYTHVSVSTTSSAAQRSLQKSR
jgi:hypothetical protein